MTQSIRTFLLVNLLLSVTLITSLAVIGSLFLVHKDFRTHLDAQLSLVAYTVQAFLHTNTDPDYLENIQKKILQMPKFLSRFNYNIPDQQDNFNLLIRSIQFEVRDNKGKIILHSYDSPTFSTAPYVHEAGFSDIWQGDSHWRVFSVYDHKAGLHIMVTQKHDSRAELEDELTTDSVSITLLSCPLFGVLIWIIIGRGLESLKRVRKELSYRAPNYLKPVAVEDLPSEIQPVIDELNRLFVRLHDAFDREKRFAADAAHELRTPLAALNAQTQVALRAQTEEERTQSLHKVLAGVERSAHVVSQLLTLSRMLPEATINDPEVLPLNKLAAEVIADLVPQALERDINIELIAPDTPCEIIGNKTSISILLRNLIDNAIRYIQEGGLIEVIVQCNQEHTILRVIDNGPGIPDELRERVFERFYRIIGNKSPGSGLGLGIVQRIVELHQAEIELQTPKHGSGLEVRIVFNKPAKSLFN